MKLELVLDDKLKCLLGLAEGQLGWIERVGTERSAWLAKINIDGDCNK